MGLPRLAVLYHLLQDVLPRVYEDYSTTEILTMDYLEGLSYKEFKAQATQEEKNQAAEIIWRFAAKSINNHFLYNGDPHPGNYLFMDGRVGFLDFGFTKRFNPEFIRLWKHQSLAACRGDLEAFVSANKALGYEAPGVEFNHRAMYDAYRATIYRAWMTDQEFEFTPDFVGEELHSLLQLLRTQGGSFMPKEFLVILRLLWGQHAILADLRARSNWHRAVFPLLERHEGQAL